MGVSVENFFKDKTILFASWAGGGKDHYHYRVWRPFFKNLFKKSIFFDLRVFYYLEGKEKLNESFLELVKKEKPEYILLALSYDELSPETLFEIKKFSPESQIIGYFGDDVWRFDDWLRYYCLFFDYIAINEKENIDFIKDNLTDVYPLQGTDLSLFKPLNEKKVYDVTFIGSDISDRYEFVDFLLKNNVKLKIFGLGWEKYKDLEEINGGYVSMSNFVKIINQSKINLNFSKAFLETSGTNQFKGRIFEIFACKSFLLTENFDSLKHFFRNYKKISFNSKEELLEKINYFLKHEKEMEKITEENYKHVIRNYSLNARLDNFFKKIYEGRNKKRKQLPILNEKSYIVNKDDFILSKDKLSEKIKDFNYISFKKNNSVFERYKDYFQIYSLKKSGKEISCCDFNLYSDSLGDYMLFMAKRARQMMTPEEFNFVLNIEQLLMTKEFFLKNLQKFKEIFEGRKIDLINNENTIFVSIPLVKLRNITFINHKKIDLFCRMIFLDRLYSLKSKQKLFFSKYPYALLWEALSRNKFIGIYLFKLLFNKERWLRLQLDRIG